MKPLLVSLLLLSALPHRATAQKAAPKKLPPHNARSRTTAMTYGGTAGVPNWATAEFCDDYARYFSDYPAAYQYLAGNALKKTVLGRPGVRLEGELVKSTDLREQVYKTLYDYCLYQQSSTDDLFLLIYQLLYHQVRMTKTGATVLAMHIVGRYGQPTAARFSAGTNERPAVPHQVLPADERGTSVSRTPNVSTARAVPPEPGPHLATGGSGEGIGISGWAFDSPPRVTAIDDDSGVVRFKININANGEVEGVSKVSGNVSPAQEKLCRDALQDASFHRTNGGSGGATGFYTFKITVTDSLQTK